MAGAFVLAYRVVTGQKGVPASQEPNAIMEKCVGMAYADRDTTNETVTGVIASALIIFGIGYMLVSGLAYEGYKQIIKHVTTVDVKEPEKKPPPPPPPPKNAPPPPIVAPPPLMPPLVPPHPQPETQPSAPPAPPAFNNNPAPPAPPAPPSKARGASPRDRSNWASEIQDGVSPDLVRQGKSGVVGMSVTIGANGKPSGCSVNRSSGTPGLDKLACAGILRYARYNPALDDAGNPTSSTTNETIRFQFSDDE